MVDEQVCGYCGKMTWRTTGRLHVTQLKASAINFNEEIDINIENETFCDSRCLEGKIHEFTYRDDLE